MAYRIRRFGPQQRQAVKVKIVNAAECLQAISAVIAKRAYEIYESRGCRQGESLEDWRLAENEILKPLCCGVLDSKEGVMISAFCSSCGAKDIEQIEVCVEPHRLIVVGTRASRLGAGENAKVYRVLPMADEIDPSSVKVTMAQHGALMEIQIRKLQKGSLIGNKAA
jgi:DUF2934 family protein